MVEVCVRVAVLFDSAVPVELYSKRVFPELIVRVN